MELRGIKPNQYGKFTKEQVDKIGLEVFASAEGFLTKSELKKNGVRLNREEAERYAIGFVTGKGWRGYAVVYDPILLYQKGVKKKKSTD